MRAVAFHRFGGPEVLEVAELPVPEPDAGEVRIRVAAAAVNPTDLGLRSGRRAAELAKLPPPYVPGMELAGTIDAVGPGSNWQTGERVLAIVLPMRTGRGAQAEQVVVPAESVTRVPAPEISLEAAATLPMNGLTARRALDLLALQPGQTLAVTGAAGAVGGYSVQLGVAEGLRVLAVASPEDEPLLRGFGAAEFVPRGPDAAGAIRAVVSEGVDGLIDAAVIGRPMLAAVRDGGGYAAVRGFPNGESERGIAIQRVAVSDYARNQSALDGLARLVSDGRLSLRVAETFAPERAADAHRKLEGGGVRGRLVIVFF
jgi:NADPH2:quinone reductase